MATHKKGTKAEGGFVEEREENEGRRMKEGDKGMEMTNTLYLNL